MTIQWPPFPVPETPLGGAKPSEAEGEREFQSWREVLMDDRELFCPDGARHEEETAKARPGYFALCTRCGHNTLLPF